MPEDMKVRYRGPSISEGEAVRIADRYVQDAKIAVGRRLSVIHRRPIILGRKDDKLAGSWAVSYESSAPPPPPAKAISPDPTAPVIIEIDDQTGNASVWQRL
jgi:hypothetical protein